MLSLTGALMWRFLSTSCNSKSSRKYRLEPEEVAIITGIGCSGRLSGYINSYGVHSIHGRALPLAQGVKWRIKI